MKLLNYRFLIFLTSLVFIIGLNNSCEDKVVQDTTDEISPDTIQVNNFIYKIMSQAYYWNDIMPDLDPNKQENPENYFNKLLNSNLDKWSFVTNDFNALISSLSGIEKSMGLSFQLYTISANSNQIVGFVEYVEPNSPADKANITRGMMFYRVNDTNLTTSNYQTLLSKDSYTLNFGVLNSQAEIIPLSPQVNLTAEELNINPIYYTDILDVNGTKVGYLVFNAFMTNYEDELEQVFAEFKSNGVKELILDLRYNGGGTVSTARLMASMIGPSSIAGKTMIKNSYNDIMTNYLTQNPSEDGDDFEMKFSTNANNLNLSRLFVLTSAGTASASEMVIYSLQPYMQVVQIGKTTVGKYYGMFVYADKETNWGILPITFRSENATNTLVYTKGLVPKFEITDDYFHDLGDTNEELLNKALSLISTAATSAPELKSQRMRETISPVIEAKELLNPTKFKLIRQSKY